jgi:hypothetical protein
MTITNCDLGSVVLELEGAEDGILENGEAEEVTFLAGTLLAQTADDGHFVPFAVAGVAELGVPKFVLTYDVTIAASLTAGVRALSAGKVNANRLIVHGETPGPLTPAILSALRDFSIIPVDVTQLGAIDNPQS